MRLAADGRAPKPVTCLTYHHFADHDTPATRLLGVTTTPKAFARQLDHVERHYNVIGLECLLSDDIPDRAALITIDDAYRSVLDVAAPMLSARGLPAVMFANPGPISEGLVPLDLLAALAVAEIGAAETARVLGAGIEARSFGDLDPFISRVGLVGIGAAKERLLARLGESEQSLNQRLELFLTPADLKRLTQHGIEIANHTRSHVHLAPLSEAELVLEIEGSREALAAMSGRQARAFALPWGRATDATPQALDVIRRSGHLATFLMHGRNNVARPHTDVWYRLLLTSEVGSTLWAQLELLPRLREAKARLT